MFSKHTIRKSIRFIHRWLGISSGLVVLIIAITGAIWSFEAEISDLVYVHRKVEVQDRPYVKVSEIRKISEPYLGKINNINFLGRDRCVEVRRWERIDGVLQNRYLYLNPYTGEILGKQLEGKSFFDWILQMHMNLLLGEPGAAIVKYATLIFFFIILSGLYLWWPKNKQGRRQRFRFEWKQASQWKRKNYDMHAVLGFYSLWIILFAVITALAWMFPWMDKAIYATATFGKPYKDYETVLSTTDTLTSPAMHIEDQVFDRAINTYNKPFESIWFYPPQDNKEAYMVYLNPSKEQWHTSEEMYFDQRSSELIKYMNKSELNNGERLRNMYYDIHIGKIWGLPGQLLMFFASLITASLPVTGFCIWWGKRKRNRYQKVHSAAPTS